MSKTKLKLDEKYTEFFSCLNYVGWNYKQLCYKYFDTNNNDGHDDEEDIKRFYELHKKKKQRRNHKFEELNSFINFILEHSDFKNTGLVKSVYIPHDDLDEEIQNELIEISKELTKVVAK